MDFATILIRKYPGTVWSLSGDEYAGLTWMDETPKPTEKELTALWPTVEYEVAWETVEKSRQAAYAQTSDPLFFQYQAGEVTKEEWEAERQRIKDLYPYPEKVVES